MSPLANPVNPRKKFPWSVEFEGLEPALVQKVQLPELSVDVQEHGVSNIVVKTGGMVKVGDCVLSKLMFMNKNENWAYNWLREVSDPETGVVGLPSQYKKNGYIIFYGPDMESVLEKWQIIGAFPKTLSKEELDRAATENLIEVVTLSVDTVKRVG